eukprot:4053759-Amphidinium_carterae.1
MNVVLRLRILPDDCEAMPPVWFARYHCCNEVCRHIFSLPDLPARPSNPRDGRLLRMASVVS